MKTLDETLGMIQLIEDGVLITAKSLVLQYGISEKELGKYIDEGQLGHSCRMFGALYVVKEAADLFFSNALGPNE